MGFSQIRQSGKKTCVFGMLTKFCGLGQALLNQVLEVIRLAKLPPIPLKAVLTDTNQTWNTLQLHEELLREREAIAAQKAEKT